MGCGEVGTYYYNDQYPPKNPVLVINEILKKIKTLGEGSFGEVYLIKSQKTQLEYALKKVQLKNTKLKIKRILGEVNILKQMDHPNIISFKGAFKSNDDKYLNIITEYVPQGDLEKKIETNYKDKKYFEEKDILNWLFQVCLAIQYLHENSIIHRDIKPSNIFLMENNIIKLGDFGTSKKIWPLNYTKTLAGSPLYSAPEVLKEVEAIENNDEDNITYLTYSFEVDIWSLGVTFCHIMSLEKPFDKDKDIINNIKSNKIFNKEKNCYIDKIVEKYSKEFLDLIDEMMTYEPSKRPSIEKILEKDIIKKRMNLYLKENKFNKDETIKEINNYTKKFRNIEKEEESNLFKDDKIDDNFDNLNTSSATCPLKEEKKKYDLARQLSIIHDYLQKSKTLNPKKED
jgi:NIMA (never in mitosis gene a)-related kinase